MSEEKAVAVADAVPATSSNPPGKVADGGVWGTVKYVGPETKKIACLACICCGPCALCILCCPSDEKDAYAVNGKVYDAEGVFVQEKNDKFVPKKQTMERK